MLMCDTGIFNRRPVFTNVSGFMQWSSFANCFTINHFEPVQNLLSFAPGLGLTRKFDNDLSSTGLNCDYYLTWYKKGNETYGNYYDLNSDIDEIGKLHHITVYPNPANDLVNIDAGDYQNEIKFIITDFSGQQCYLGTFFNKIQIDFSKNNVACGIYFIRFLSRDFSEIKKLVYTK